MNAEPVVLSVPVFSTLCNAAFALRREVFVWEQNVPEEEEHDLEDHTASHYVAIIEGEVIGTLRMIRKPEHTKIGRVAVRRTWRGRGVAKALIGAAMEHARSAGETRFYLGSQSDKVGLYEKLGFHAYGDEFVDGGMPHRSMRNYQP